MVVTKNRVYNTTPYRHNLSCLLCKQYVKNHMWQPYKYTTWWPLDMETFTESPADSPPKGPTIWNRRSCWKNSSWMYAMIKKYLWFTQFCISPQNVIRFLIINARHNGVWHSSMIEWKCPCSRWNERLINHVTMSLTSTIRGQDEMASNLQTIFFCIFLWMEIVVFWPENSFLRLKLTMSQHSFRWWLRAEQTTSHYLNRWWLSSLTHLCPTRPWWVNVQYDIPWNMLKLLFCYVLWLYHPFLWIKVYLVIFVRLLH